MSSDRIGAQPLRCRDGHPRRAVGKVAASRKFERPCSLKAALLFCRSTLLGPFMPNKFFAPGEHRAEKVNELFTAIAPRYDLINDLQSLGLHRYWKRRLIQLARVQPGERALDVCCGTGDLALALARRGAHTVGPDFNDEMLRIAVPKAGKSVERRVSTLRFVRGDAQQIPFPDNSFDIVTIGYGLRNLASWEIGLREMERVARPGGRLL